MNDDDKLKQDDANRQYRSL